MTLLQFILDSITITVWTFGGWLLFLKILDDDEGKSFSESTVTMKALVIFFGGPLVLILFLIAWSKGEFE